ncbi:hypothetical protein V3C99_005475 [Haemonchus contortus]
MWRYLRDRFKREKSETTGSSSKQPWVFAGALQLLDVNDFTGYGLLCRVVITYEYSATILSRKAMSNIDLERNFRKSLEELDAGPNNVADLSPLSSSPEPYISREKGRK